MFDCHTNAHASFIPYLALFLHTVCIIIIYYVFFFLFISLSESILECVIYYVCIIIIIYLTNTSSCEDYVYVVLAEARICKRAYVRPNRRKIYIFFWHPARSCNPRVHITVSPSKTTVLGDNIDKIHYGKKMHSIPVVIRTCTKYSFMCRSSVSDTVFSTLITDIMFQRIVEMWRKSTLQIIRVLLAGYERKSDIFKTGLKTRVTSKNSKTILNPERP